MLGIDFTYLCLGHFGSQKQPKVKQIMKKAGDVAKEWKEITVNIYGRTKSEEQVYKTPIVTAGSNEYTESFPDFIMRSILSQLTKGQVLSLTL